MGTYVILTRLAADAFKDPSEFPQIAKTVADKIKADCPQVTWKQSYVVSGLDDILDIVEAPDISSVERACMIIRAYGHGTTETLVATPWAEFLSSLGERATATVGTA